MESKAFDDIIEEGRNIKEMFDSGGWKILERYLKQEIEDEINHLREIETEGKGLSDIAAEFLATVQKINGLERVFDIIKERLTAKKNAEDKLR